MTTLLAVCAAAGGILVVLVLMYNALVGRKNQVEFACGGIDAQLKKRHDLIPNLVSAVGAHMKHERATLTALTELRSKALSGSVPESERLALEAKIGEAMRGVMVAVESYPELRSSESFIQLQRSLNEVEEQLSAARRTYNAAVTDYNNGVEMVPLSFLAGALGYARKPVFEAAAAERANVDVGKALQA